MTCGGRYLLLSELGRVEVEVATQEADREEGAEERRATRHEGLAARILLVFRLHLGENA